MAPPAANKNASTDPLAVLREGIKNVPAVRYASGVLGVAAAASLIRGYFSSMRIGVYATLAVLGLMLLLWIFAMLARLPDKWLKYPAIVVAWSLFSVIACVPILLVLSVFFSVPRPFPELRSLFETKPVISTDPGTGPAKSEPARFAGTITDSVTSKPLAEVEVRMTSGGPIMAKTDSDGVYRFSLATPPPESVTLIYEAPGHQRRTENVFPSQNLDFQLSPVH